MTSSSSTTTRGCRTAPSGRSTTTWSRSRSSTGSGGTPTGGSTSASPRRRPSASASTVSSGCRTTSSSWCPPCSASSARTCGSASSCTSRSRRASCSASCPGATASSRDCSGPTWWGSSDRAVPRTSPGWYGNGSATRHTGTGSSSKDGRHVRARSYPISLDVKRLEALSRTPEVEARAAEIRSELGNPRFVFLGVDRLDYTKGIRQRLRAFGELIVDGQHQRRGVRVRPGRLAEPGAGPAVPRGS